MRQLVVFTLFATSTLAAEPDTPARKRQEAIKSIEFVCRFSDVTEAGGQGETRQPPNAKSRYLPFERESWEGTVRVLIDGERSRVEITKTREGGGTFRRIFACDGSTRKRLDGSTDKMFEKGAFAVIEAAAALQEWPEAVYQPVFLATRPLGIAGWRPWLPLTQGQPTGNTAIIDQVSTDEWSWTESPATFYRICLDPHAGHAVRRVRLESKRSPFQTDILWKQHNGLWLPDSWETVWTFDDGTPRHTIKATVERIRLNEPIPDSEFDLTFPPGVKVLDERTNSSYLVREDGSLGEYTREPNGQPIPPPPLTQPKTPNWFAAYGPMLFGMVLVIVVVGLLVLRRASRVGRAGPQDRDVPRTM